MSLFSRSCPACQSHDFFDVVTFDDYLCSQYSAKPINKITNYKLSLEACQRCDFVRQKPETRELIDYKHVTRPTSQQLPDYTPEIITKFISLGISFNDLILEIGTNDGSFLKELRNSGFNNLLGIEPSEELVQIARSSKFEVISSYFDIERAEEIAIKHGLARAVICRHTLEHVPDIEAILNGIKKVLSDEGIVYIEVPDFDWTIEKNVAYEIWHEHLNYFNLNSLGSALFNSEFDPIELKQQKFRHTRNLMAWASKRSIQSRPYNYSDTELKKSLLDFEKKWNHRIQKWSEAINSFRKPIIAVGASHEQINFLNFSGLGKYIDAIIDDDPYKVNKYVYIGNNNIKIFNTHKLKDILQGGTVLFLAFPYPSWFENINILVNQIGGKLINFSNLDLE